ncbi:DUF397 domain-containing protein [Streptomyces sp. NPDC049906]|uniref:DUF397 domain-containing protein n=1 Tax=Streptomyces sp. NPDC049906 TaxID=3155656 RepID=UPI00342BCF76
MDQDIWLKSSYSNPQGGNCLEWAPSTAAHSGTVPVRDSKSPDAGTLLVPHRQWTRFVRHISA